jgi:adenylosuccinate lyase
MRRLFWLVMGITIGALIVRKLSAAAAKLTPRNMAASVSEALSELAESLRDFSQDVREAMSEREAELRAGTGLDGDLGAKPVRPDA